MAEVIEHLYTAAQIALSFLAQIMRPGAFAFLQTPNAVALHKRLQMLSGRNPYMSLDEDRLAPGHFREYTVAELSDTARQAGLEVFEVAMHNYFTGNRPLAAIYNRVCEKLPGIGAPVQIVEVEHDMALTCGCRWQGCFEGRC